MRTKRKYAHELYPHPGEYEVRPLEVEVPYLYAMAVGMGVFETDWFDLWNEDDATKATQRLTVERTKYLIQCRQRALLADALLQGMGGQEAWEWAESRYDESGEIIYDRATHYGVPVEQIKPYPVVAEPDHHNHYDEPDVRGWRTVHRVEGKESECPGCCEPEGGES